MARLFKKTLRTIEKDRIEERTRLSVETPKIIGDKTAFDCHHGARSDAFGLVMMSAVQQIRGAEGSTETQG